jgi:hypothetical protein
MNGMASCLRRSGEVGQEITESTRWRAGIDSCVPELTALGSYLAVPLTSGGGLLSGVKLKKEDQKLTLGFEGRLAPGKQPYSAATSNARL